jgi:predicted permease
LFAAFAGLLAAVLYGLIPALRASRPDLMHVLRASSRTPGLGGGTRFRNGIVAFEIALSFVLLIGSGLMFRSFLALQNVDLGYNPEGILTLRLNDGQIRRTGAFMREIRDRLSTLPGVEGASRAFALPLSGTFSSLRWGLEESLNSAASFNELADTQFVLPGYFETMGSRLIEGRTFADADNKPEPFLIVIDSLLARKAFPNQSAVGKRIVMGSQRLVEVIGVVEHHRISSLVEDGRPQIYFTPETRGYEPSGFWVIRTAGDPAKYAAAVRAEIASINPSLKVTEVQPLQSYIDRAQSKTRFSFMLLAIFATIAVLLAGIGLYGVLATLVRQRSPEIGVRMALGATPAQVFKLIVGQGVLLSAIGILVGAVAAFALTRLMVSLLVRVQATDPITFAATAVLFLGVALIASWLPARRAASLDPAVSLREE